MSNLINPRWSWTNNAKSGRIKDVDFLDFSKINLFYFDKVCWIALAIRYNKTNWSIR